MIKEAAIRKDGIIYTGKNHAVCLSKAPSFGYLKDGEQGFITDDGEFVDRVEALKIATECNQILKKHGSPDELYSEDLYMER